MASDPQAEALYGRVIVSARYAGYWRGQTVTGVDQIDSEAATVVFEVCDQQGDPVAEETCGAVIVD